MVLNADQFHFLTVGFNKPIPEISEEKVVIVFDIKLSFGAY